MRTRGIAVAFACVLIVGVLATAADARTIPSSAAQRPVRLVDPTPCGGCWHPAQKVSWQWQLHNPPTAPALLDVKMYDVDGFDASKTLIAAMHARGIKAVCYISAGSWENWRPDVGDFPAADLGKSNGWPGERWLDIRDLAGLGPIMSARLDICRRKGFDAVEFDNVDGFQNGTGFPLKGAEQLRYNIFLANEAHARGMSAFLKNDIDQVKTLPRTSTRSSTSSVSNMRSAARSSRSLPQASRCSPWSTSSTLRNSARRPTPRTSTR